MRLLLLAALSIPALTAQATPLQELADDYVQQAERAPAVALLRITEEGVERAVAGPESVTESSLFEIGSVTKVFTSILLAELVAHDLVSLDTTVGEVLGDARELDAEVATITLRELSTHTSGLPRLPFRGRMLVRLFTQQSDPYRGSTTDELFDDLAAVRVDQLDGRGQMNYSNFGAAVLGRLLELAAGESYEALIKKYVLTPMGLEGMGFADQHMDDPSLVHGHRGNLRPTPHWHSGAYAPSGGMVGSLAHLEHFLLAAMAAEPGTPLATTIDEPLGWIRSDYANGEMIWHNGQTGGFHAFVGFDAEAGRGVVVLSNAANSADQFAIGLLAGNSSPERPSASWLMLGFTVLFTLMGVILLLSSAFQPVSRLHSLDTMAASLFLLGLTWKIGVWTHVPLLLWYIAALVALVLATLATSRLAGIPWTPPERPWATAGKSASLVLYLLLAWVVIFNF